VLAFALISLVKPNRTRNMRKIVALAIAAPPMDFMLF
jgi:hypothetical protein